MAAAAVDHGTEDHLHYALLRISGRAPDDLVAHCRRLLWRTEYKRVAACLLAAAAQHSLQMERLDAQICAALVGDAGVADQLELVDGDVHTGFSATNPIKPGHHSVHLKFELPPVGADFEGDLEQTRVAAVKWAETMAYDVNAVWRALRRSVTEYWPPPRLVWVVEVEVDSPAVDLCASLMQCLEDCGSVQPLVEVYHRGTRLPSLTDLFVFKGERVWAQAALLQQPMVLVDTYDWYGDPPGFHASHPRIYGAERDTLVAYLGGGSIVLYCWGNEKDAVVPAKGEVVPISYLTDGVWIWQDSVKYYLQEYGYAPNSAFLEYLRSRAGTSPAPSALEVVAASDILSKNMKRLE